MRRTLGAVCALSLCVAGQTACDTRAPRAEDAPPDSVIAPDSKIDATPDGEDAPPAIDAEAIDDARAPDECPWSPWDEGLGGGRVDFAAFDPRTPGLVWAASGGALARSLDDAATFTAWSNDLAPQRLAFPPDDPKRLLAATGGGLFASDDGGRSFSPLALGGLALHAVLVHPALPLRVFAGGAGTGILRSDDGGHAFRALNAGVPRMFVEALAAPRDDPDRVLATGVLESDSYGAGASGVILRSEDGGLAWTTVSDAVVWGTALAFCPSDPQRAVAAVRAGALASEDGGASWEPIAALAGEDVIDVAYGGTTCERLYASVYREGVYRLDGAALTAPSLVGLELELANFAGTLAAHPADPDVVLVASHAGLFRSEDGAARWDRVEAGSGLAFVDLASFGANAWLTTWGSGLWRRSGETPWTRVTALPRDFTWLAAPLGDALIVGSQGDVWVSFDQGGAFAPAPGLFNATDALALHDPDEILAATQVAGVQRSAAPDAGWSPSNEGLEPFATSAGVFIDARALVADPQRPERLYLGLRGAGVALSEDRGARWRRPDNALSDDQIVRLAALDGDPPRLFALVVGKGVWVSYDGALSWRPRNDGLASLELGDMVLDAAGGALYVSELAGVIYQARGDAAFDALAAWCLPVAGWGALAISALGSERWLVATTRGNRVVRHRL